MKIRTDFVSNSSSSSFIISDNADFFNTFNITKDDIKDVVYTLYFGKNYKENIDMNIKNIRDDINKSLAKAKSENNKFELKWAKDRLRDINRDPVGVSTGIYIYDMDNDVDRKNCYKNFKDLFKDWDAPNVGTNAYRIFKDALDELGIHIYGSDDISDNYLYWDKDGKSCKGKVKPVIKSAFKEIRKIAGIKTMYDVAFSDHTKFVFHFDDNVVWECNEMCEPKNGPSKYETEEYTTARFYEVLVKKLLKLKKINLNDSKNAKFKNWWKVPKDHWWKDKKYRKHHPKNYFTRADDDSLTWFDIVKDSFNENSIGHEG